jgi:hypothetical protein
MPIKDDVSLLADKAKWKAGQQMRLLNIHNSISQKEGNIKIQKAHLADTAVKLFYDNQLNDENIKTLCLQIQATFNEIDNLKQQEIAIHNERPPENVSYFNAGIPSEEAGGSTNSLVCPKCGRELRGRFCPEHGIEGIEKKSSVADPAREVKLSGLVCPVCGKELLGQFCPDHGAKGVPQTSSTPPIEIPASEDSPKTDLKPVVMVCPVCGKPLKTRFCNQHGVEGVPQVNAS